MTLGSLREEGIVCCDARPGWHGSCRSRRLFRILGRHGDEAIVQKNQESLKERVPEGNGKLRSSLSGLYCHPSSIQ